MEVTFYGVRGSTPCSGEQTQRYGGNTSCVVLTASDHAPIVLDLGTGLRPFGTSWPQDVPFVGHGLVTHLHWDHVQGLPFFTPIHNPQAHIVLHGPAENGSFESHMRGFMRPPYFPVELEALGGKISFENFLEESKRIGRAEVLGRFVPHVGLTNGYRISLDNKVVTYISDHQQPYDKSFTVPQGVQELCHEADVLIHDAQYTDEEFQQKTHWGHCTIEYALSVAATCKVKHLVLFHHDPSHADGLLDAIGKEVQKHVLAENLQVSVAFEGMRLDLS